jgi:hypothetical protein
MIWKAELWEIRTKRVGRQPNDSIEIEKPRTKRSGRQSIPQSDLKASRERPENEAANPASRKNRPEKLASANRVLDYVTESQENHP